MTPKLPLNLPAARACAEAALTRANEGKPLPVTDTRELARHTLDLVELREQNKSGRPTRAPTTPDGRLVATACDALGSGGTPLPRSILAARLGYGIGSAKSISPKGLERSPLSEERRAMLRTWIAGKK